MPPCILCGKSSKPQVCSACMHDLASVVFAGGKLEQNMHERLAAGLKRREKYEASQKQVAQLTTSLASLSAAGRAGTFSLKELANAVRDAKATQRKLGEGKGLAESLMHGEPEPQPDRLRIDALEF